MLVVLLEELLGIGAGAGVGGVGVFIPGAGGVGLFMPGAGAGGVELFMPGGGGVITIGIDFMLPSISCIKVCCSSADITFHSIIT